MIIDRHTDYRLAYIIGETHAAIGNDEALPLIANIAATEPQDYKSRYKQGHEGEIVEHRHRDRIVTEHGDITDMGRNGG